MGFKEIKYQAINCLEQGHFSHEQRNDIDIKNLLATGDVTTEEIVSVLKKTRGGEHESSPHHYDPNISVHIVKTFYSGVQWYIKWYFLEPNCVFISVHE